MTTEQTAQQLELAAQILRTGHPWEYRVTKVDGEEWHDGKISDVSYYAHYSKIRLVLATPPDNRPLHNPDNLTVEQVGVGYRLALPGESAASPHDFWDGNTWKKAKLLGPAIFAWCCRSCRLLLSVPWPEPVDPYAELKAAHAAGKVIEVFVKDDEYGPDRWSKKESDGWPLPPERYRIKPTESAKPEPAFQLPPPPPGMRWHREAGWTADDLPQGYRPLVEGEKWVAGDEILRFAPHGWQIGGMPGDILDEPTHSRTSRCRTTRPLTFQHAGKTWTWHRPGDPMPCDGDRDVCCLVTKGDHRETNSAKGRYMGWSVTDDKLHFWGVIIGWRYADEKKTAPLGPEDVPPCSAIRGKESKHWFNIVSVHNIGISISSVCGDIGTDKPTWGQLAELAEINRSIPLTGKWNPDAWEPCSKEIPA